MDRNNMFLISNTQGLFEAPWGGHNPTSPIAGKGVSLASKVEFPTPSLLFSARQSERDLHYRVFSSLNLFGDRGKWNWIVLLVGISNSQIWIFVLPFSYLLRIPFKFYPQVLSSISCPFFIFRLITSNFIVILIANVGCSKSLRCSPNLFLHNQPCMSVLSKIATWATLFTAWNVILTPERSSTWPPPASLPHLLFVFWNYELLIATSV